LLGEKVRLKLFHIKQWLGHARSSHMSRI
jgi:hypothetical protein